MHKRRRQDAKAIAQAKMHQARLDAYCAAEVREGRFDADTGLWLAEELTHVSSEMVSFQAQDYKYNALIPLVGDNPGEGAQTYAWDYMDWTGEAEVSETLQGDSPEVNVDRRGRNRANGVYQRVSYGFADDDIERAKFSGVSLDRTKPLAARDAIERKKDDLFFNGDATRDVPGLLTDTNVPNAAAAAPLSTLSASNLLAFYLAAVHTQVAVFGDSSAYYPDTLLLPQAEWLRMRRTFIGVDETVTVYSQFLKENGYVNKIEFSRHMNTSGTGSSQQLLLYKRVWTCVGRVETVSYAELAPQRIGHTTKVHCRGRIHGTVWRVPLSGSKIHTL